MPGILHIRNGIHPAGSHYPPPQRQRRSTMRLGLPAWFAENAQVPGLLCLASASGHDGYAATYPALQRRTDLVPLARPSARVRSRSRPGERCPFLPNAALSRWLLAAG